jgi:16S rRNA (uracil1498-N3)-methyltransferase
MPSDIRLHVSDALAADRIVETDDKQAHYLKNVMRRNVGDEILLFNGRDGEWRAVLDQTGKRGAALSVVEQTREQESAPDLWLLFAQVKRSASELIVEKATELGIGKIQPVLSERTNSDRINLTRLGNITIEAAEQSRRLDVPEVNAPARLEAILSDWPDSDRRLFLLDETGGGQPIAEVLEKHGQSQPGAFLIGPEGGFSASELDLMAKLPFVTPISLGKRILRAETAVIAALSCWQAMAGDWT